MNPKLSTIQFYALIEGLSLIILMAIGMPLKYYFHIPEFVKIFGWVHGILFIGFSLELARTTFSSKIPIISGILIFLSAFIPFGNFWAERHLKNF